MKRRCIYLDYNATTPVLPEVAQAVELYLLERFGNPSCGHLMGQEAKKALEEARKALSQLISAEPEEVYFVSGGTEANNLALFGAALVQSQKRHLITSRIEHPSVLNPCVRLLELGYEVSFVEVDAQGKVDPEEVARHIREDTFLISIMLANNETGVIQPVREIGHLCAEKGLLFHTDAAQAVGKIPVSVKEIGCHLLTIAGHKFYAPKGIGALYVRKGTKLEKILFGAGQERGLRPGTEPVALAVGLGKAAEIAERDLKAEAKRQKDLRERLYQGLKDIFPSLVRHGPAEETLPNTLSVAFPGHRGEEILKAIPEICASTGAACHDRSMTISHVLSAMKVSPEVAQGTIRFSLGRGTNLSEIEETLALFRQYFS